MTKTIHRVLTDKEQSTIDLALSIAKDRYKEHIKELKANLTLSHLEITGTHYERLIEQFEKQIKDVEAIEQLIEEEGCSLMFCNH